MQLSNRPGLGPGAGNPRARLASARHHLCIREPFDGQRFCWCMCDHCWQSWKHTQEGKPKGRCVCTSCPCRQGLL